MRARSTLDWSQSNNISCYCLRSYTSVNYARNFLCLNIHSMKSSHRENFANNFHFVKLFVCIGAACRIGWSPSTMRLQTWPRSCCQSNVCWAPPTWPTWRRLSLL